MPWWRICSWILRDRLGVKGRIWGIGGGERRMREKDVVSGFPLFLCSYDKTGVR